MAQFVRARLADGAGQPAAAAQSYAALLLAEPGDIAMALRAYRGGLAAGDAALALRAAKILAAQGALPAEGRLLLLAEALTKGNKRAPGLVVDTLEKEANFEFIVPVLRAWADFHAGVKADALDGRAASGLTSAYAGEQRALLRIAQGRTDEGVAIFQSLAANGASYSSSGARIAAAGLLTRKRKRDAAMAVLTGQSPAIAAARLRAGGKGSLVAPRDIAATGVSLLLLRLAEDIGGREPGALSVSLARIATFLDPLNDAAWLASADMLRAQDKAEPALAAVGKVAPKSVWASQATDLRVTLLARGEPGDALELARAAIRPQTARSGDFTRLGDLLVSQGRQAEAATAYREAIARSEEEGSAAGWSVWLLLGSALKQAGDWDAAKPALEIALKLAPGQAVVLNYLGYAQLERRENLAEAEALIARANAISPDDASFIDSLGWAYHVRGDSKKAVATLERAVAGLPAESIMNEHLGDAYWAAGRRIEARYAWRNALVTADEDASVRLKAKGDFGWTAATAAP